MNVLYTIVPPETIFGPAEDYDQGKLNTIEMVIDGVTVMVEPLGPGRGKVQRLLSTNPSIIWTGAGSRETVYW